MTRQLARIALRHLARHPWQLGLAVLGIALGVAVAVSIDLANESARRAFQLATLAVTGRATHQIVGGPSGLPEDVYRALRMEVGTRTAAPILSGDVAADAHTGRTFTVLGIDPFAEAPFRPFLGDGETPTAERGQGGAGTSGGDGTEARPRDRLSTVAALVTRPGAVLVARPTARDFASRWAIGSTCASRARVTR